MIAAEPCDPNDGNYGKYDPTACNECAKNGKGRGQCCDAIYRHSLGRDDDDILPSGVDWDCRGLNYICDVGKAQCIPGLYCANNSASTKLIGCQLIPNDPNAHAASSLLTSSSTGTTTNGGHSFVLIVVGLLGTAMITMKVVLPRRHRVLLHRHQYSEVDTTATHIEV